eukprot:619525-Alexandrium_andersonii.AAC.1
MCRSRSRAKPELRALFAQATGATGDPSCLGHSQATLQHLGRVGHTPPWASCRPTECDARATPILGRPQR